MFFVKQLKQSGTVTSRNGTVSFLAFSLFFTFFLIFFVSSAYAQIQYYGVDVSIDDKGKSAVQMTITFSELVKEFNFTVVGSVQNFKVNSTAGSQDCILKVSGITMINCKLNLTQEKRTVIFNFETFDYMKDLGGKFFFDTDFSLGKNIEQLAVSVRLPEGKAIVSETVPNRISFPEVANIMSDGRRIIITWRFTQVQAAQSMKFQILYETIIVPPLFDFRIRYALLAGGAIGLISTFVYLRYFRKPEKVILSVLDEYERRIFDLIVAAGGTVNQRKIVQETNLSKAKVSRVVKSLVERGVIEVERIGRTNKLKILKKKFMM